ncbi:MAG TPA: O-antigen ligase family protein [bacterium]|nr:O-antigen ligase family protein [bacterium]
MNVQQIQDSRIPMACLALPFVLVEIILIFAGLYVSIWLIPSGLAVLALVWWIVPEPRRVICLWISAVPLLPLLPADLRPAVLAGFTGLVLMTVWGGWLTGERRENNVSMPRPVGRFILIYMGISLAACLFSVDPAISLREWLTHGLIWVFFFGVFRMIDKNSLPFMAGALMASTVLMLIAATPDLISGRFLFAFGDQRLGSFYENPNNFAVPFIVSIPLFASAVMQGPYKGKTRMGLGVLLGASLICVLITNSRSAYLSVAVSLSVIFAFSPKGRWIWFSGVALASSMTMLFFGKEILFLLRLGQGLTGRGYLWRAAWRMMMDHPFGTGPGTYEQMKGAYILPADWIAKITHSSTLPGAAHNLYLTWGAELGLLTAVVLTVCLAGMTIRWFRIRSLVCSKSNIWLFSGALAILCGLFARAWFESGVIINDFSDSLYFLLPIWILTVLESDREPSS